MPLQPAHLRKPHRLFKLPFAAVSCLTLSLAASTLTGCGYHQVGAATHIPANVRTIAVPIFVNRTQSFHTEMAYTQATVRELNTRTHYRVLNRDDDADAVLKGTILSQAAAPLTYDANSGETSSYLITITASIVLTARDGRVLYRNDAISYRETYQSTQDVSGFLQEDGAAVSRIAHDFSRALVSDMLESF